MKLLIPFCLLLAFAAGAFGDNSSIAALFPSMDSHALERLMRDRSATRFYDADDGPQWPPVADDRRYELSPWNDYNLGVESIFIVTEHWDDITEVDMHNALRSISSLQGIEYYSVSRGTMRVLFEESWTINNLEDQERVPDPIIDTEPMAAEEYFISQKDRLFGRSLSRVTYPTGKIGLSMANMTRLYLKVIPAVAPENLKLDIAVVPLEDAIVFYGTMRVHMSGLAFVQGRIESSIENRIIALFNWFASSIGAPPNERRISRAE